MQIITMFLTMFFLAIATSLDSLGVGVSYGLAGIRVRLSAHLCICAVMMAITWTAVACGNTISQHVPENITKVVSALVFAGLGIWVLWPLMRGKRTATTTVSSSEHSPSPMEVLENPQTADTDGSRVIDLKEASLLGVALSLNNIVGGVDAGMIRLNPFGMASLCVFFNVVCLVSGHLVGKGLNATRLSRHAQVLSGVLLILVGLWELK